MKQCVQCKQWKPLSEFHKCAGNKDGHQRACKDCRNAYNREFRQAHSVEYRLYRVAKYAANKEYDLGRRRERRVVNREREKARDATYYYAHKEQRKLANMRRRALLKEAAGASYTTAEHLRGRWAMWGGRCWICGERATATDHVKPLAVGGAHWPCNLRPICKSCNAQKGTKWVAMPARLAALAHDASSECFGWRPD